MGTAARSSDICVGGVGGVGVGSCGWGGTVDAYSATAMMVNTMVNVMVNAMVNIAVNIAVKTKGHHHDDQHTH